LSPRDSKIEKWRQWLDEKIRPEVIGMYHHRRVYRTMGKIVERHGSLPPSNIFDFLRDTYVTTQSVAVRRQAETGSRVISLGTLLGEIVADPARLTRDWYLATFDADDQHYAAEVWQNGWFAGPSWQHVNPGPVRDDLSQLAAVSDQVREYVNRHLAHHDRRPLSQLPTFADLNSAIDTIGDLARKYAALLTNTDWITLVPVIQYNWLAVFQEPWIKDEQVLYDLMSEDPLTGRRS
jgi:hypothetical protein